jgi:hypothetical protein
MAELRQLYAAAALSGLVGCRDWGLLQEPNETTKDRLALRAFELADAMLKAERPPEPEPTPEPVAEEPATPPADPA